AAKLSQIEIPPEEQVLTDSGNSVEPDFLPKTRNNGSSDQSPVQMQNASGTPIQDLNRGAYPAKSA
ncbi:MAG: hypothetical protein AAF740_12150, partial [Bacteroidota bacterium]